MFKTGPRLDGIRIVHSRIVSDECVRGVCVCEVHGVSMCVLLRASSVR